MEKVVQEEVNFDNLSEYSSAFPRSPALFTCSKRLNLSFLLRVDSAFICLGTTRAKAGAEGFVKVHNHIHIHCRDGTLCIETIRWTTIMWLRLQSFCITLDALTFICSRARSKF